MHNLPIANDVDRDDGPWLLAVSKVSAVELRALPKLTLNSG